MNKRIDFIDWLKAIGMFLIVFGHVIGPPFSQFFQPIYIKQIGVALFIFVIGWSLANEGRDRIRVIYNRLFQVFLFGIAVAVFISCIKYIIEGELNLSNYEPFFLGINVVLNNFPANPTTWYIGTYVHIILLWCIFLYNKDVSKRTICVTLLIEIVVRALIMSAGKLFIAYMIFPNWATVFLLGMYMRKKGDTTDKEGLFYLIPLWFFVPGLWALILNRFNLDTSFPFRNFPGHEIFAKQILRSGAISFLYIFHAILLFQIFRRVKANGVARFFSRNTLLIFIIHMALYYALYPWLYSVISGVWFKRSVMILILYVGIGLFSEYVVRISRPTRLREYLWEHSVNLFSRFAVAGK